MRADHLGRKTIISPPEHAATIVADRDVMAAFVIGAIDLSPRTPEERISANVILCGRAERTSPMIPPIREAGRSLHRKRPSEIVVLNSFLMGAADIRADEMAGSP
jgi:hypothetical protein